MRNFGVFVYQSGKDQIGIMHYMITVEEKITEGNKVIARLIADEHDLEENKVIARLFAGTLRSYYGI